jgi:DNA (cytosine-5)-methyltransferase 1
MTKSLQPFPAWDFFAGSGLVTEGLTPWFFTVWANDLNSAKAEVFLANHPREVFRLGSVEDVQGRDLPPAMLSWGSFPCQDLSLAGRMGGLSGARSGLVWQWLRVMDEAASRPPLVVAENVPGLLTLAGGAYYRSFHEALAKRGYLVGPVLLDAARWLPQSRRRVFVIALRKDVDPGELAADRPGWAQPDPVRKACAGLHNEAWWRFPEPEKPTATLEDLVDSNLPFEEAKQESLREMIPPRHLEAAFAEAANGRRVFPGFKRMRNGRQFLELRSDGLAGCLRTPGGGSSRQYLAIMEGSRLRIRLLSVSEAAALMGAPAGYRLPVSASEAYRAIGDAVAVPVTRHLAEHLLHPLAMKAARSKL